MSLLGQIRWSGVGRLAGLAVGAGVALVGLGAIAGAPQAPRLSDDLGLGDLAQAARATPPPAEPPRTPVPERRPSSGRDQGERERTKARQPDRGDPGERGEKVEPPVPAPQPRPPAPPPPVEAAPAPAATPPVPAPAPPASPAPASSEFSFEH
jgi:hypothetical protein